MSTSKASQLPLPSSSSLFHTNSLYLNGHSTSTPHNGSDAGPSRKHGGPNGRMNHHHRSPRPRQRSVSRSSSSPSPPPTLATGSGSGNGKDQPTGRDKRRSSSSRPQAMRLHSNGPGSGGGRGAPRTTFTANGPGPPKPIAHVSPSSPHFLGMDGSPEVISPSPSSPTASLDGEGFSTQYGASASSPGGLSGSEVEMDRFVSARGEETETETLVPSTSTGGSGLEKRKSWQAQDEVVSPLPGQENSFSQPVLLPPSSGRQPHLRPRQFVLTLPSAWTVLPLRLSLTRSLQSSAAKGKGKALLNAGYSLTRRRSEDGLVLGVVIIGVWKLAYEWNEKALAGEIGLLIGLSIIYTAFRARTVCRPGPTSPSFRPGSPASSAFSINGTAHHARDRSARHSSSHHGSHHPPNGIVHRDDPRIKHGPVAVPTVDEGDTVVGGNGCVWGTEEREYRECPDDGVFFALLLGPILASAMLHTALTKLSTEPSYAVPNGWIIEPPLVLPSTPVRHLPHVTELPPSDAIKALSALATSRRNLVQLFTLCSFVLLVQLGWSLRLELRLAKAQIPTSTVPPPPLMQREGSDQHKTLPGDPSWTGTYWLRQGKWRRNLSAVGLGFAVTAGCIVVKVATAYIGHGVWSDMSPSDIIIATLFYQFSLYVCVRLARRGFTLGELGVVCTAATALFMETVNLTRMKIRILRTPYIKTYRLPTPLLTFQLALIPGSLLAGFLLSPLLYLSRHLAQRPAHRLRFPHEKPMHRRLLALGFYAGTAIVCGGLVATWTAWCLGRNPYTWIIYWLLQGRRAWTRPVLISYWGLLAAISVAGWNRQLVRGRRHRRYVVPGTRETREPQSNQSSSNAAPPSTANAGVPEGGISGVAAQMIDAADQKMPVLSVNARRKFFHALAVVMFVPGIAFDPAFTHLSFSVAFAAFNFAEYIRYFALWPFGVSVHLFLNEFLDAKDSGTAILSHFYLLAGCAAPLWLEGDIEVLHYFGVISLGVGDALASIIGRKFGRIKWSRASGKTVEGSIAFALSILLFSGLMWAFGLVKSFNIPAYTITTLLCTLLEAFSAQNDNLILPMYGWAVGTLLGV